MKNRILEEHRRRQAKAYNDLQSREREGEKNRLSRENVASKDRDLKEEENKKNREFKESENEKDREHQRKKSELEIQSKFELRRIEGNTKQQVAYVNKLKDVELQKANSEKERDQIILKHANSMEILKKEFANKITILNGQLSKEIKTEREQRLSNEKIQRLKNRTEIKKTGMTIRSNEKIKKLEFEYKTLEAKRNRLHEVELRKLDHSNSLEIKEEERRTITHKTNEEVREYWEKSLIDRMTREHEHRLRLFEKIVEVRLKIDMEKNLLSHERTEQEKIEKYVVSKFSKWDREIK